MKNILSILILLSSTILLSQEKDSSYTYNQIYLDYLSKADELTLINYDSSIYYFELTKPYFKKTENWEKLVTVYTGLSRCYYLKREITPFDANTQKAYSLAQEKLAANNISYLNAQEMMGLSLILKENYTEAIHTFNYLLEQFNNLGLHELEMTSLSNLAGTYFEQGRYQQALALFEKSYDLSKRLAPENEMSYMNNLANLAYAHFYLKDYEASIAILEISKKILIKYKLWNKPSFFSDNVRYLWTKNHLAQGNYEQAKNYLKEVVSAGRDSFAFNEKFKLLAKIANQEQECEQAILNASIAKRLTLNQYKKFKKHNRIAREISELAKIKTDCGELEDALSAYQEALVQSTINFNPSTSLENPTIDNFPIKKGSDHNLLQQKAQLLHQIYDQTQNSSYLEAALDTYVLFQQYTNRLRQNYDLIGSEIMLTKNILPHYETAILIAFKLYEQTGLAKYQEIAFVFSEGNKSIALLESIKKNLAKGYGGVPDSLLAKEKKLNININFYKKQIAEEQGKIEPDLVIIKQFKSQLSPLETQYLDLVENLESNYPKYAQQKNDFSTPSISKIQAKLSKHIQVIEYFVGEKNIFIFSITSTEVQLHQLPLDTKINDSIDTLLQLIQNNPDGGQQAVEFQQFTSTAYYLYTLLLQPVFASHTNQLIIIPDDQLNFLPFEVLLTKTIKKVVPLYADLPYLLKTYQLNYHYSFNLYEKGAVKKTRPTDKKFIGFAPSFNNAIAMETRSCTSDELYSLSCAEKEIETIASFIDDSHSIIGLAATKSNFHQIANQANVIHLATHACLNEEDPMLSKIYFADDYLSYYDLNNLNLNADLAVLSACNTGSGRLQKGEGVMSLAKGFMQAGVPSIVTSLWAVDDCATSNMMILFYQFLLEGQSKDAALRNAKLTYLQTADKAHAHPFYWGAFVQIGQAEALSYLIDNHYYWYLNLGAIALFFIGIFYRFRFSRIKRLSPLQKI